MLKSGRQLLFIASGLVVLSIVSTGSALFAAEPPESVLPKTYCRGLLSAGTTPGATNPLLALREVQGWLLTAHPGSDKEPSFYKSQAYQTLEFEDDFLKPRKFWFEHRTLRGVLDRLSQLEEDTTRLRSNETFMAREFRGQELITRALEPMLREIEKGNPELNDALNRAYHVWTAGATVAVTAASNVFMDPLAQLNSVHLKNQMQDMNKVLAGDNSGTPISIVSGHLDVQRSVENSEGQNLTGEFPHIFYDSIFYVDPQTSEPVWLVYYRAFKNRPSPPQPKGRKKREAGSPQWQGVWQPELAPVPIPVPVDDRPRR